MILCCQRRVTISGMPSCGRQVICWIGLGIVGEDMANRSGGADDGGGPENGLAGEHAMIEMRLCPGLDRIAAEPGDETTGAPGAVRRSMVA
jgi:hypothetical protein